MHLPPALDINDEEATECCMAPFILLYMVSARKYFSPVKTEPAGNAVRHIDGASDSRDIHGVPEPWTFSTHHTAKAVESIGAHETHGGADRLPSPSCASRTDKQVVRTTPKDAGESEKKAVKTMLSGTERTAEYESHGRRLGAGRRSGNPEKVGKDAAFVQLLDQLQDAKAPDKE